MKHTVSFFKIKIKEINDLLEKENYIHRLRMQFVMEKWQLNKLTVISYSLVFKALLL